MNDRQSHIPEKPHYRLREVCEYTDTQPYVLRFWEGEFPQLAAGETRSGQRLYTRQDIDLILRIKELLYVQELTISAARRRLERDRDAKSRRRRPELPRTGKKAGRDETRTAEPASTRRKEAVGDRPNAGAARASREDLVKTLRQEVAELRRRVGDVEDRWRKAEQALESARRSRDDYRERCRSVARELEGAVKALDSLRDGSGERKPRRKSRRSSAPSPSA